MKMTGATFIFLNHFAHMRNINYHVFANVLQIESLVMRFILLVICTSKTNCWELESLVFICVFLIFKAVFVVPDKVELKKIND